VLYIEDNTINTVLVARILRSRPGVRLESVPDGRSGLDRIEQRRPDLVLLDLSLPDIDGEQVLAVLRAERIPAVVISADIDPAVRRRVLTSGARDFLVKPYEVASLLRAVDDALRDQS
jgi:CheY-like chemotaxis protein